MSVNRLRISRRKKPSPGARKRPAARRSATKTAALAATRAEGDARNAARALDLPYPPRQRKSQPTARKPAAKAKVTLGV